MSAHTSEPRNPRTMRRQFVRALGSQIRILWPIISLILVFMVSAGLAAGFIEGWALGDSLYFTFVTGLTIGYGDVTPTQFSSRVLALAIGFAGIVLAGLIAAMTVQALNMPRQ